MKKIVQDIIHYPDDCEIGVLMCFNLMYDQAEKVRIPHAPASPPAWCTDFNRQCDYCGACGDEAKKDRPVYAEAHKEVNEISGETGVAKGSYS